MLLPLSHPTTTTTTNNFLEELMTLVQLLSTLWEHMVFQMGQALCYNPELIPNCVMGNLH